MKLTLSLVALIFTFSAFASERVVLEVAAGKVRASTFSTRFEINLNDGTAGASLTAKRSSMGPRDNRTIRKTFEALVPELSLVGNVLVYTDESGQVECGTMGETRVFKRPVLNLTGNCSLVTRRAGKKIQVVLVTK